ncbi:MULTISPECIES: hypothetical protein [unclassified Actinoplanes]|uniref:VHL beta domain-containing protein n=1 Tax=unclassified Actinoplanes TaxID=2626549 RepID=UPI0012F72CE1|nr:MULTISPECIES: hypothetical protein [unclassified Actinoplanes]
MTPPGDPSPDTGRRVGATPAPRRVVSGDVRHRIHLSRRYRLIATGLAAGAAGIVSGVSLVGLLRPTTDPAEVHAGAASVAVTNPGWYPPRPQIPVSVEPSPTRASLPPSRRPPASPAPTAVPATVTILPADHERDLRSVESDRETEIRFVNRRDEPIVINWLDYRGKRENYGILAAGGVREQVTYVNHPWVITDLRGRALAILLPDTRPAQATIT